MSKAYEFLKECGVFYVLTVNDNTPAGRPFGAVMEHEGKLYISTATGKEVYKQMKANENVQIIALKGGTRNWVRISGKAAECTDVSIKGKMLEVCPVLSKRFPSADCDYFALFGIDDMKAVLNTDAGIETL